MSDMYNCVSSAYLYADAKCICNETDWGYIAREAVFLLSVSSLSSESLFMGVCRATLLSTSSSAASLRPMLPVASGYALQVAISSSCHDTVAPSSAVGHFLLQARQRRHFQAIIKDMSVYVVLEHIAHQRRLRNSHCKFSTYLLTYLLLCFSSFFSFSLSLSLSVSFHVLMCFIALFSVSVFVFLRFFYYFYG